MKALRTCNASSPNCDNGNYYSYGRLTPHALIRSLSTICCRSPSRSMVQRPDELPLVCVFHRVTGMALRLPRSAALFVGARIGHESVVASGNGSNYLWRLCHEHFCGGMGHGRSDLWISWRPSGRRCWILPRMNWCTWRWTRSGTA